jgi:hypothetical protein
MITVVVSADLFWGFSISLEDTVAELSLNEQNTLVNTEIKRQLIEFFSLRNLQILKEKCQDMHLHIHSPLVANSLCYACDHREN